MKLRTINVSFLLVFASSLLVSCGTDTSLTTGAEELTATTGSQSSTNVNGPAQATNGAPSIPETTLYEGFEVLCQDGFAKTINRRASAEALYTEASALCAGRVSTSGKEGIAQYGVIPVSEAPSNEVAANNAAAAPANTQPIGFSAQCQDGTVLAREVPSGMDPYAEAQAACRGKRDSVTQKEGLNSYSAIFEE